MSKTQYRVMFALHVALALLICAPILFAPVMR